MARSLSRVTLREASARSANRVAAWISDNALPPLSEVVVTLEELRDSPLITFGPTKIVLSQLSELIVGSPPMHDLLRMRKVDIITTLLRFVNEAHIYDSVPDVDPGAPGGGTPTTAGRDGAPGGGTSTTVGRDGDLGSLFQARPGPLGPLASPRDPQQSTVATCSNCTNAPAPGFSMCGGCAALVAIPVIPSPVPDRSVLPADDTIEALERRIRQLHATRRRQATSALTPGVTGDAPEHPPSPSIPVYSDSSASSAEDGFPGFDDSSVLMRYRRKLLPLSTTKQNVFDDVSAELAKIAVSLPVTFPVSPRLASRVLSELLKRPVTVRNEVDMLNAYRSVLTTFLSKHAAWACNPSALRKRSRPSSAPAFNARLNPKSPRTALPDIALDGHHIGECRAFVNEHRTWEASAESDVIPPLGLDFLRRHVVPPSCSFAHPTQGVYNIFKTPHEQAHATRRARAIYRDSVNDVAVPRIARFESLDADRHGRLREVQARAARRSHGTLLSATQRRDSLKRESATLARLALETRLVMCGSRAWKTFFAGLDASADADLVARGLGLPDDSDDESERARHIAAKAWKAASAVALSPSWSYKRAKTSPAPVPKGAKSFFEAAAKRLEATISRLGAMRPNSPATPSRRKDKSSRNRCYQCYKRGCRPSDPKCSHKGKAAHPKSRNARKLRPKKSAVPPVPTAASSSAESSE